MQDNFRKNLSGKMNTPGMTDRLLKLKTDKFVYCFFLPWVIYVIAPWIALPVNEVQKAVIIFFFIAWVQAGLFFVVTFSIGNRLILNTSSRLSGINAKVYFLHSFFNFVLISTALYMQIDSEITQNLNENVFPLIVSTIISEILRAAIFSKRLVSIEISKEARLKDYIATTYLLINPLIGVWNLHPRILAVLGKETL